MLTISPACASLKWAVDPAANFSGNLLAQMFWWALFTYAGPEYSAEFESNYTYTYFPQNGRRQHILSLATTLAATARICLHGHF
jgi:hypothetical protein